MAFQLEFKDLRVTGKQNAAKGREFLHGVSGCLQPGKMTAIMGSSGAGKTVLLSCLSGRTAQDAVSVTGEISLNGQLASQKQLKACSAIVMQDDVMLSNLTVREQIEFHAKFGLPKNMDEGEIRTRVDKVIEDLQLTQCQNTRVGSPGVQRGVSGGERKRTAIAMELISDPEILFLDEPTSGLDSHISLQVLQILKNVAQQGRTVAFSIHQPSSEIFQLFDNLILVCEGHIVYFGAASEAVDHFASLGHYIPPNTNPAEFYLSLTHGAAMRRRKLLKEEEQGQIAKDEVQDAALMELGDASKEDLLSKYVNAEFPQLIIENIQMERKLKEIVKDKIKNRIPWTQQLYYLTRRSTQQYLRSSDVYARFFQTVGITLFAALLFIQLGLNTQGIQSRVGFLFVYQLQFSFLPAQSAVLLFPLERPVFIREQAKSMYHTFWYFLAKNIVEIPMMLFTVFVSVISSYYIVGLRSGFVYCLKAIWIYMWVGLMGQGIGFVVGSAISSVGKGMEIAPSIIIPQMLVSGLFFNIQDTPVYFIWFQEISYLRWSFEALIWNEFENRNLGVDSAYAPTGQGNEVVSFFGFDNSYWMSWGILAALVVVYRVIAYFFLHRAGKKATPI